MDVQKERIRQKICDAVAQIWRKETGSTVPLCVEGTVCVTPWHGRTSAFHTLMQIPGTYPLSVEVDEALNENPRKRRRLDSLMASECLVDLGCAEEADLLSEADEDTSSSSMNKSLSARDDNNNQSGIVDAETDLEISIKDEPCTTDDSENNLDEDSANGDLSEDGVKSATNMGPVCPRAENYACSLEDVGLIENNRERKEENQSSSNADSGVQDLSGTEAKHEESPNTSQVQDSVVTRSQEDAILENEADRATPTPLVVDLSWSTQQTSSHQTSSSQTNHAATVQTAIRNMLSVKLAASSNNKTSGVNGYGDSVPRSLLSAKNGVTPELVLSKSISVTPILKTGKLVRISPPASQNLPRHSTPISVSYSFNGKVIEKPLHSLLGMTTGSSSSTVNAYIVSPKLEMPTAATISLPVVHVTKSSADSVNLESSTESAKNGVEQKTYNCKHCDKRFLFKSKYEEHMPVHTSDRPFQCTSCQRTYKYKYDLNVHLRTHQGIPTKSTICPFCTKKFKTNKMLRLHITEDHKDQQQEAVKGNLLQLPSDENSNHSSAVLQDNSQVEFCLELL